MALLTSDYATYSISLLKDLATQGDVKAKLFLSFSRTIPEVEIERYGMEAAKSGELLAFVSLSDLYLKQEKKVKAFSILTLAKNRGSHYAGTSLQQLEQVVKLSPEELGQVEKEILALNKEIPIAP